MHHVFKFQVVKVRSSAVSFMAADNYYNNLTAPMKMKEENTILQQI